jgi:hypothetical protein
MRAMDFRNVCEPCARSRCLAHRGLGGVRAGSRALQDIFLMSSTTRQVIRVL